jgi:uncharacterized protein
MTQTATTSVDTMKALYDAFGRGDIAAVIAGMDEAVEWNLAEGHPWHTGRALVGPQEVLEGVLARIAAEYDDFRVVTHRFIGAGDTVVVEARYEALRARATGRPLHAQAAHVWDLRDGKVVRFQQYIDTRQLADVLGAGSP